MSFTFHAKYALLTYAQCDGLDPWDVLSHFTSLESECIISREDHADGGTHLHVFADFGAKRKYRRADVFDVSGYHPNIIASRGSPERGYDYATKDGDVICGGLARPGGGGSGVGRNDSTMAELVTIETECEFWDAVKQMAPGMLLRNFPSLKQYVAWRFAPVEVEYRTPEGLHFVSENTSELDQWASSYVAGVESGVAGR